MDIGEVKDAVVSEIATRAPQLEELSRKIHDNPETAFDFTVPADDHVKIDVFNAAGQRVDTLVDNFKAAGAYKVTWNGRDSNGEPVSSGVYFYRMQAGEFSAMQAMTLLK